jgi:hypothetical protein
MSQYKNLSEEQRERRKQKAREYYHQNKEKVKARYNKDLQSEYNKEYYQKNKEHFREKSRKYQLENAQKVNEYQLKYYHNRMKNMPAIIKPLHSEQKSYLTAFYNHRRLWVPKLPVFKNYEIQKKKEENYSNKIKKLEENPLVVTFD